MTQNNNDPHKILTEILKTAAQVQENLSVQNPLERKPALAVFDLDSTLFDVSPRMKQILHDFAADPSFAKSFPQEILLLKKAETLRSDWGIKQAVIRVGLEKASPEFHLALKDYWIQHFFSNPYLHHDIPYEGAAEYVQKLWNMGVEIVYLTGRDVHRMGVGSEEVLLKWKFPLDGNQARLVLKPEKGLDDAKFKSDWFAQIPRDSYQNIWFFENEPVNVNLVLLEHKHIEVVFFESTHSGKEQAPASLPRVPHFLTEKK